MVIIERIGYTIGLAQRVTGGIPPNGIGPPYCPGPLRPFRSW
jgi:hypothetical protein